MAHEIENAEAGDKAHFFEVGMVRSAWHRLGQLWATRPTSVAEMFDGAPWLDYPVVKLPVVIQGLVDATGAPVQKQSEKAFVTIRTDTNLELGSVGADYEVVQNREAIENTIGPMVDAGLLNVETGGVLRDGADAFVLSSFNVDKFGPIVREVFADEIIPYALVRLNHSGRRTSEIAVTDIRTVCANTLQIAEAQIDRTKSSRIIHRGNAGERMSDAATDLFGGLIERHELVAKQYRALKNVTLSPLAFNALALAPVIGVHPTRRETFNPEAKLADSVVQRYETRRDKITWLWENGKGHVGDHSAWEALNGVIEAIDHNENLFPTRSGVFRLGSLLDGELRSKKDRALDRLSQYAVDGLVDEDAGRVVFAK